MISNAPNISRLWSNLIIEELIRCGVTHFCIAPGSRSTPLVTAVAENARATPHIHFDERATAYYALGLARALSQPVAWITTSGTAVVNGMPAIVEAHQDGVPLILLTADRPPELRDSAANQTIDQQKVFGGYVNWFFDLPAPDAGLNPHFVLTTIDQAVHRAIGAPPGPAQLNCMFREPLAPVDDGLDYRGLVSGLARWERSGQAYSRYRPARRLPEPAHLEALAASFGGVDQGVILAGRLPVGTDPAPVVALARALNWPLIADVGSQSRFGSYDDSPLVNAHHLLLGSPGFCENARPRIALHLGGPFVSKRVLQFVRASAPASYIMVQNGAARVDPEHIVSERFDCEVGAFCDALLPMVRSSRETWSGRWRTAARVARDAASAALSTDDAVSEPWIGATLPGLLPPGSGLFLGSSMPIRDVDIFAETASPLHVAANRGASGIDGTLASAAGFCEGLRRPTVVLLGDLALLHDLNSLAIARSASAPLVIVVINNDGGGIFSFLPIAHFEEVFEPYFGTPHGLGFEAAATMFGLRYERPETRERFKAAVGSALLGPGATLIEVQTDRRDNVRRHQFIERRVAAALSGLAPG